MDKVTYRIFKKDLLNFNLVKPTWLSVIIVTQFLAVAYLRPSQISGSHVTVTVTLLCFYDELKGLHRWIIVWYVLVTPTSLCRIHVLKDFPFTFTVLNIQVHIRDASIRYSGSVSAPIRSFSADRVSERRDRSKSDIVCILFCVIVKPHESTKAL